MSMGGLNVGGSAPLDQDASFLFQKQQPSDHLSLYSTPFPHDTYIANSTSKKHKALLNNAF